MTFCFYWSLCVNEQYKTIRLDIRTHVHQGHLSSYAISCKYQPPSHKGHKLWFPWVPVIYRFDISLNNYKLSSFNSDHLAMCTWKFIGLYRDMVVQSRPTSYKTFPIETHPWSVHIPYMHKLTNTYWEWLYLLMIHFVCIYLWLLKSYKLHKST